MLADFAFADLLLYVALPSHDEGRNRFLVVNQVRPNTGQTLFLDDVVGRTMDASQRPLVAQAMASGHITSEVVDSVWLGEEIRVTAIPVRFRGRVVAVMAREASLELARDASDLASVYLGIFERLARMVADGEFPFSDEEVVGTGGPRVGDGVVLLDEMGRIAFASPNAVSALRRLGVTRRLMGEHLTDLGAETAATYRAFFNGRPTVEEVERDDVNVVLRCIPLIDLRTGRRRGGPAAGRVGDAEPGPRPGVQGRDHQGDPPPGQEQPPDHLVPVAPAGPAPDGAVGQGRHRGIRPAHPLHRARARDAVARRRRRRGVRRGGPPPRAHGGGGADLTRAAGGVHHRG